MHALRSSCFYPYVTHMINFTRLPPFSACNIENTRETGDEATWGHNFYTGTQNGSKLEIWPLGILINALELLWSSPICLYAYAMSCATWWAGLRAHIYVTTFTRFAQNWSMGSLLAVYGSTMHSKGAVYGSTMHSSCSMRFFQTIFFFFLLSA
jgi:hypothetical protein